jgi:hypothetical protein
VPCLSVEMSRRRAVRGALGLLVLLLVVPVPAGASPAYRWPVDGAVVRGFDAPPDPWAAGHRGVDLAAGAGEPVRAMAAGRVTFAGAVAGSSWVTVLHDDGIRTSYGPVTDVAVRVGERVAGGAVVATAAGGAHGVGTGLLHVGARRGDVYIDPAGLVAPPRLVPTLVGAGESHARGAPPAASLTLVPGAPPSPNHLLVLAGLTSATGGLPFDPALLGYGTAHASQFSYAGLDADGVPRDYDASATWQRVHDAAVALRDQLRARWAAAPGEAVDLAGHSLGGLVAMYYLLVLHDPADPTLPPIGRVVTIASPLHGADLADTVADLQRDPVTAALLALADAMIPSVDADAPVLTDLRPGSEVTTAITAAWRRVLADRYETPLANGTQVLTIGALLDPVVPEHRSDLTGTNHRTVIDTHGDVPGHAATLALLGAFLAGQPLPERGVEDTVATMFAPLSHGVSLVEQVFGTVLAGFL